MGNSYPRDEGVQAFEIATDSDGIGMEREDLLPAALAALPSAAGTGVESMSERPVDTRTALANLGQTMVMELHWEEVPHPLRRATSW